MTAHISQNFDRTERMEDIGVNNNRMCNVINNHRFCTQNPPTELEFKIEPRSQVVRRATGSLVTDELVTTRL